MASLLDLMYGGGQGAKPNSAMFNQGMAMMQPPQVIGQPGTAQPGQAGPNPGVLGNPAAEAQALHPQGQCPPQRPQQPNPMMAPQSMTIGRQAY